MVNRNYTSTINTMQMASKKNTKKKKQSKISVTTRRPPQKISPQREVQRKIVKPSKTKPIPKKTSNGQFPTRKIPSRILDKNVRPVRINLKQNVTQPGSPSSLLNITSEKTKSQIISPGNQHNHDFNYSGNLLLYCAAIVFICLIFMCCFIICVRLLQRISQWIRAKINNQKNYKKVQTVTSKQRRQSNEQSVRLFENRIHNILNQDQESTSGSSAVKRSQRTENITNNHANVKEANSVAENLNERKIDIKNSKVEDPPSSSSENWRRSYDEFEALDQEHQKNLEQQNLEHEERMRKEQQKREETKRRHEEELKQMKLEFNLKLENFWKCIQLKLRFEEKEQEWADGLRDLKQPLITIVNSYHTLQEIIRSSFTAQQDEYLENEIQGEGKIFAKKIFDAQRMFSIAFNNLQNMSKEHNDRVFLRIIMKTISEQAHRCNSVGEKLSELRTQNSSARKQFLAELDAAVSNIKPHFIPTTGSLKISSKTAHEDDFLQISDVPYPNWSQYFQ